MPKKKTATKKKTTKKAPAKKTKKPVVKKSPAKKTTKTKDDSSQPVVKVRSGKTPTLLRGMKDILPKEEAYWKQMNKVAWNLAEAYGFGYLSTPVLEEAALFVRSIGRGTDVVDKEMYIFEDRDGTKVALRPELTASVARAYIGHGMHNQPQPVKTWYMGPMFRHDRPQAGRFRQFHQFDCETIGDRDPFIDAELIVVAYNFLRDLGLDSHVYINSIGTLEDRERYIIELVGYLRSKRSYLSEESKKRITKNPLRVLDSKDEADQAVIEEAPQIIDWLSDDSKDYFMKVLEYLDELDVPYILKPTLVRGLDYYTDTVFELYQDDGPEGSQSALGGGGRYDGLIEQLGGREAVPAAGFALGLERIISALRKANNGEEPVVENKERVFYFAQLGEQAKRRALYLIEQMRREGITVKHNLAKSSLKVQLEMANKYGASHAIILGQKEVQDGTVILRDMDSGIQETVDQKKLVQEVKKIRNRS